MYISQADDPHDSIVAFEYGKLYGFYSLNSPLYVQIVQARHLNYKRHCWLELIGYELDSCGVCH